MSKAYDTAFTDSEEGCALRDTANKRLLLALGLLPDWRAGDPLDQQMQALIDLLLQNPTIWTVVQNELATKVFKKKSGRKAKRTAERLCALARAFNAFKAADPQREKLSDTALVPLFRKKHGKQFDWLLKDSDKKGKDCTDKTVEDCVREGRRLLAPEAERLIKARRECLAMGSTKDLFEDEQKKIRSAQLSSEELNSLATTAETANAIGKKLLLPSNDEISPTPSFAQSKK